MNGAATKVPQWVIYWAIVILPFSVACGLAFTNILIGLMAAAYLVKKAIVRELPFPKNPATIPFLCIVVIALLSFFNTIDLKASRQGISKLFLAMLTFTIIAEEIKDRRHLKLLVWGIIAGSCLAAVDGIWQVWSGRDFIRGFPPMNYFGMVRATAVFEHPTDLGVYMSAVMPLVVGCALFYWKGIKRIGVSVLAAIGFCGLMLTYSRGAAVGFFAGVVIVALLRRNKVIPVIVVATITAFVLFMPTKIKTWAASVNYDPVRFMLNDDRISIYKNAVNMIAQHPVIGVGVNTFCKNYKTYKVVEPSYAQTSDSMYAHNIYLHMGGEIGLIGVGCFLWFLTILFVCLRRARRLSQDKFVSVVSASLAGCIAAFMINGLTETSLYYPRVVAIFWIVVGMSLAMRRLATEK